MRRKLMYSLGLTLVVGLLGAASAMATEASAPASPLVSCGHVCVWSGTSFSGSESTVSCSGGTTEVGTRKSAADGCANETVRLNNGRELVACMSPGGERPNPGEFKTVTVSSVAC
jgi:hypothetical protein